MPITAPTPPTVAPPVAAAVKTVASPAPAAPADCSTATRLPATTPPPFAMAALDIIPDAIDPGEKRKLTDPNQ